MASTARRTGLEDVSCYPALLAELMRRGYTHEEIKKLAGLNLLRVFREVEKVSARLKRANSRSRRLHAASCIGAQPFMLQNANHEERSRNAPALDSRPQFRAA